jgi:UDP-glucuronate 4-epimerase
MRAGRPLPLFGDGSSRRDYTYIDDIVDGVVRVLDRPASADDNWSGDAPDPATSSAPYALYNIGNNNSVGLDRYIEVIESCLGKKARKNLLPLQPGDVEETWADVDDLVRDFDYRPDTPIEEGVRRFVDWYRQYYGVA